MMRFDGVPAVQAGRFQAVQQFAEALSDLGDDLIAEGAAEIANLRHLEIGGFILDGYPRNLAQADALDKLLARIGQPMDYAVQLEVPTELLVERIAGRAKAEGRADDSPESVRTRLKVYDDQTAPVIEFYRQHGQLTVVNGVGSLDEVFTRIVEALSPGKEVG